MYQNRLDAGERLALYISGKNVQIDIVLAIPRGGVEVAGPVAVKFNCPLKVVIPRKIGAPGHEEMAIGAIAWDGTVLLNERIIAALGISESYISETVAKEKQEIARRNQEFPFTPENADIAGKNVLLVDDGIATGYTVKATIAGLKNFPIRKLYLAVPVGARDTIHELENKIDAVFCPLVPEDFWAVGQFYKDFSQITDARVLEILERVNGKKE